MRKVRTQKEDNSPITFLTTFALLVVCFHFKVFPFNMQFIIQCTSIQSSIIGMLKKMVGFHHSETYGGGNQNFFF